MTDWGALYRDHVEALAALAETLDDDQLTATVPGSPAWTVHDVYAHLAGGAADQVAGRTEGAPGPEWTSRHVGERQGLPVSELVAELRLNTDTIAASLIDDPSPGVVWDVAVHHADLHEALGKGQLPERFWAPVLEVVAPRFLAGAPLSLTCGATTWGAGGPAAGAPAYEVFRGLFSRRSRAQLRAWGPHLGEEDVDLIGVFGPREDDQPVP